MLVRQLEDEVVKAKTQASHTNPEVSFTSSFVAQRKPEMRIIINVLPTTVNIKMKADTKRALILYHVFYHCFL